MEDQRRTASNSFARISSSQHLFYKSKSLTLHFLGLLRKKVKIKQNIFFQDIHQISQMDKFKLFIRNSAVSSGTQDARWYSYETGVHRNHSNTMIIFPEPYTTFLKSTVHDVRGGSFRDNMFNTYFVMSLVQRVAHLQLWFESWYFQRLFTLTIW